MAKKLLKEIKFGDEILFAGKIFIVRTFDHRFARLNSSDQEVSVLNISADSEGV